jgi:hypothetical protein
MAALLRLLVVVPFGFVAAVIAGAFILSFGFFGRDLEADLISYFIAATILITMNVGAVAFFPALIAIALAELFSVRSIFYWLVVGGLIGLAGESVSHGFAWLDDIPRRFSLMLAAGFVGGFVYWLIAGRLSGQPSAAPA